ncbi:MAG: ester cyclase [Pseudomonadota bacterium]
MTMSDPKALLAPVRAALYAGDVAALRTTLDHCVAVDAPIRFSHPLPESTGPESLYQTCFAPLLAAIPDLERRDTIVIAGPTPEGATWVGCGGYYTGKFKAPWLDIPPTGHLVHMRFHEFYRIDDGKITEVQALWDIPEVMLQAGCWPMAPSLGREWHVPGPATQDGLVPTPRDPERSDASCQHIIDMLEAMKRHPSEGGPEVMEMHRFWHPRMTWYGPSGIGTGRGIEGFRRWHQIPFLKGMPDRGQYVDKIEYHFFGDGDYAAVTGWPNMIQTHSGDGWLGLPPTGKLFTMRSLDFWRIEKGLIRENWVLVDLLDAYAQLGVDVMARMREMTGQGPRD